MQDSVVEDSHTLLVHIIDLGPFQDQILKQFDVLMRHTGGERSGAERILLVQHFLIYRTQELSTGAGVDPTCVE